MIGKIIIYAFLLYLLYRLVFNVIIPIVRTTRKIKRGMREMNEKMNAHFKQQAPPPVQERSTQSPPADKGDYIDFEEVK